MTKIFEEYFKGKRFLIKVYPENEEFATYVVLDMDGRMWDSALCTYRKFPSDIYRATFKKVENPLVEYESEFLRAIVKYMSQGINLAKETMLEEWKLISYQNQLSSLIEKENEIVLREMNKIYSKNN